ncbi:MAG: NYN domain-containing protein [Planctomycetes bacterium]|nr:NYN domain-containing protein [Planctomycetota bacterium]
MSLPDDAIRRIALLMDFENIVLGLPSSAKFRPKAILSRVLDLGKVVIKRAYADWSRYDNHKVKLHELGFDLLEIPKRAMTGKNAADIRMVVDAMDVVISKEHVDTFALVTGDSDFTPLAAKLRELDKRVIGIGVKDSTSKLLIDACDEFIFYDELDDVSVAEVTERLALPVAEKARAAKGGGGAAAKPDDRRRAEGLYLLLETTRSLLREYDTLWASMVKQTIMRKQPAFSESYHGYPTFTAMIEDAVKLGILKAARDEKSGNWKITGIGDQALALLSTSRRSAGKETKEKEKAASS